MDSHKDVARRWLQIALPAFVVFGIALRVIQYLWQRSYWYDEGLLLVNVRDLPWAALARQLEYGQGAPVGFLFASRVMVELFGYGELATRFIPMLAGCASVVLFALLVRRAGLGRLAAVTIVAAFAMFEGGIVYSATFKQYNTDILAALVLFCIATDERASPARRLNLLAIATIPLQFLAFNVVIGYAGLWFVLAHQWWSQSPAPRRPFTRDGVALTATLAAVAFGFYYLLILRHQRDPYLQEFWAMGFANFSAPLSIPRWLISETYNHADRLQTGLGALVMILWVVAGTWLWRSGRRTLLLLCIAPVVMNIITACFQAYPFQGGRVSLFLLPGTALLAGLGIEALARVPRRGPVFSLAAAAPFVVIGVALSIWAIFEPHSRSMIGPAVAFIRQHAEPADVVYLVAERKRRDPVTTPYQGKEFFCYWKDPHLDVRNTLAFPPVPSGDRFWVVFAFLPEHQLKNMKPLLDLLARSATEEKRYLHPHGGAAVLYRQH